MFNPQTEVLLHFLQSICRNQEIILFLQVFVFFLLGFENKITKVSQVNKYQLACL